MTSTVRDTPLRAVHERLGATMTEFAGWLMPLRYGSETAEHNAVRTNAALFDLSHMGEIAVTGPGAGAALDYAVCGWPSRLAVGRARYTMLCAPDGGVLDDLIIYRQADERFLVVANAANTSVVLGELRKRCSGGADITDESEATGLVSIQGPNGCGLLATVTDLPLASMPYYAGAYGAVAGRDGLGREDRVHRRGRLRDLLRAGRLRADLGRAHRLGRWRPPGGRARGPRYAAA